jgi:hypothetical protein
MKAADSIDITLGGNQYKFDLISEFPELLKLSKSLDDSNENFCSPPRNNSKSLIPEAIATLDENLNPGRYYKHVWQEEDVIDMLSQYDPKYESLKPVSDWNNFIPELAYNHEDYDVRHQRVYQNISRKDYSNRRKSKYQRTDILPTNDNKFEQVSTTNSLSFESALPNLSLDAKSKKISNIKITPPSVPIYQHHPACWSLCKYDDVLQRYHELENSTQSLKQSNKSNMKLYEFIHPAFTSPNNVEVIPVIIPKQKTRTISNSNTSLTLSNVDSLNRTVTSVTGNNGYKLLNNHPKSHKKSNQNCKDELGTLSTDPFNEDEGNEDCDESLDQSPNRLEHPNYISDSSTDELDKWLRRCIIELKLLESSNITILESIDKKLQREVELQKLKDISSSLEYVFHRLHQSMDNELYGKLKYFNSTNSKKLSKTKYPR